MVLFHVNDHKEIIEIFFTICACLISNHFGAWGCSEYARYLMHRYGDMSSHEKKRDKESHELIPYDLKYEKKYKTSKRLHRFKFFLWISRLLMVLLYFCLTIGVISILVLMVNSNIEISSYVLILSLVLVIIPNVVAVIVLVPFGYISHLLLNSARYGKGGDGWID